MLTPRTSISNLHQTLIVPGAQETQTTQRAIVEGVMARDRGPIERAQVPGHYPTISDTIPEQFTASKKLFERAEKLRESMQAANNSEIHKNSQILERAVIHGKYLEEYTKYAKASGLFYRIAKFPEIETALGFENPLFSQVENSLAQAQKELEDGIKLHKGERGRAPVSASNLKNLMRQQAALFDEQLQNFDTARAQKLSPKDRSAVLKAELNFSLYAAQTTSSIPLTISNMRNLAKMVVEELQEKLNSADAKITAENDTTSVLLQEWRDACHALDQTLAVLVPELAASVERSKLAKTISDLQGSGSWGTQLHSIAGQLFRQAILSGVALGVVNSFTSELLSKTQIPTIIQMLLLSSITAVAHEFSTHVLAAGILELTGGATKPVNGSDVTSAKNKFISDNGNLRIKTATEIKIQHELQTKFKQELKYAENANKLGTVWSEAKYASIFGLVQGVGSLIGNGPGSSSACSVIAGGIVGAAMAAGGLNAGAMEPGGRKIPAMEPTYTSRTLGGAKSKIASGVSAKMNYLNETNRQTIQNKFGGLLSGEAAKRFITFIANIIESRYPDAEKGIQATARALGSVANLLALYGSMKIADETKVYVQERLSLTPAGVQAAKGYFNFEGPKALATMSRYPNHPAIKQVFPEGSVGRIATNIADSGQKALNIPMATVNAITNGVAKYAIEKSAEGLQHLRNSNIQSDPERDAPDSA